MINSVNSLNTTNPLQNFMNNLQQNNMKLHEVCNNFSFGLMKLKDAAKMVNVPESTFRTWRQRGDIPEDCFKVIGGSVFIKSKKFQDWVDN